MTVVATTMLSKRYGKNWALRDCNLQIPVGAVVALVGPNGAGKTTLLDTLAGLTESTSGDVELFGGFQPGSAQALGRTGFVPQSAPLPKHLSVRSLLEMSHRLNATFDRDLAYQRLETLRIPLRRRLRQLSGGQQAQIALTIAIARRPELLLLDEPTASLDPLARQHFLTELMAMVASTQMSVIFSSHSIAELEKFCDYLIVIASGNVQLSAPLEEVLGTHFLVRCDPDELDNIYQVEVIERQLEARIGTHIVKCRSSSLLTGIECRSANLESIVLAYLKRHEQIAQIFEAVDR